jgi:putative endonuclease
MASQCPAPTDPEGARDARTDPQAAGRSRAAMGAAAEAHAAEVVQRAGFTLVARNYRCRRGELDIVARRADLLIIAEVRLRRSDRFGGAAASIGVAKRLRIRAATRYLLLRRPELARLQLRFDVLLATSAAGPFEWIEGVF